MTLTVAGLDGKGCRQLARRVEVLAHKAGLPVDVRVTTDALDVQRAGEIGACTLVADGRVVAQDPFPGDAELEKLLATLAASAEASAPGATAA